MYMYICICVCVCVCMCVCVCILKFVAFCSAIWEKLSCHHQVALPGWSTNTGTSMHRDPKKNITLNLFLLLQQCTACFFSWVS